MKLRLEEEMSEGGIVEEELERRGEGGEDLIVRRQTVVSEEKRHAGKVDQLTEKVNQERKSKELESEGGREMQRREYVKDFPEALSKRELEFEMLEREKRRKNIVIKGIGTVGKGIKEEIKGIIKKYLGLDIYINKIRAIGRGLVVEP